MGCRQHLAGGDVSTAPGLNPLIASRLSGASPPGAPDADQDGRLCASQFTPRPWILSRRRQVSDEVVAEGKSSGPDLIDASQILWTPAGVNMTSLDEQLVDVTDGDTPNMRMPIRVLSVANRKQNSFTRNQEHSPLRHIS